MDSPDVLIDLPGRLPPEPRVDEEVGGVGGDYGVPVLAGEAGDVLDACVGGGDVF